MGTWDRPSYGFTKNNLWLIFKEIILNKYGHIRSYPYFHILSRTLLDTSSRVPEVKYGNLDRRLWTISQHNLLK